MTIEDTTLSACYRLLSELLLYPETRDEQVVAQFKAFVDGAPECVGRPLKALLANPRLDDCGLYIEEVEMSGKRQMYLGSYLFDEPDSCQSAGTCGRNGYMIELNAVYRHFGLTLDGGEMPDYLPLVLDFLAATCDRRHDDSGGHRTRLLRTYIQPAIKTMQGRFAEEESTWASAVEAVAALIQLELEEPQAVAHIAAVSGEAAPSFSVNVEKRR